MTDTVRYWKHAAQNVQHLGLEFALTRALAGWLGNRRVRCEQTLSPIGITWTYSLASACGKHTVTLLSLGMKSREGRPVLQLRYLGHPVTERVVRPHRIADLLADAASKMGATLEVAAAETQPLDLDGTTCTHLARCGHAEIETCHPIAQRAPRAVRLLPHMSSSALA